MAPERSSNLVMTKTQPAILDGLRSDIHLDSVSELESRGRDTMHSLLSPDGMKASLDGRFHHFFGRDTMISASFILAAHEFQPDLELWSRTKQAVFSFWRFQREDGKIIHEAITKEEMFKKKRENPCNLGEIENFYRQQGEYFVNDDSVDATPLALIATPQFVSSERDKDIIFPQAKEALRWMIANMEENNGFLRYSKNKLTNQGWMDSKHGVVDENGEHPDGPIALVEAQAFAWKAMRTWSDLLKEDDPELGAELWEKSIELRKRFNEKFMFEDEKGHFFAHALDGRDQQVKTPSINPGLALWASHDGETILYDKYVPDVVSRLTGQDFFDPAAGICTFEDGQPTFDDEGYHNGKRIYWPFATAMVAKGMVDLGYREEAKTVLIANMGGVIYFNSFVETFAKNGSYKLFRDGGEDGSCKNQAWTIAEFLWTYRYLQTLKENDVSQQLPALHQ